MAQKSRIIIPDSMRQPGAPANVLFRGVVTNRSTGRESTITVKNTISPKGVQTLLGKFEFRNFANRILLEGIQEHLDS